MRRSLAAVFVALPCLYLVWCVCPPPARADVPVVSFRLDNGVEFLLVRRAGAPMTAAAWVVAAGSADETPGRTGVSHLLEHLLFNGTRTIGTRSLGEELRLLDRRAALHDELLSSPAAARRRALEAEIATADARLRELQVKGEYALVYTEAGAVGINALTRPDLTLYYMMLPPESLEVWFWMESDRLLQPVFRGFWGEIPIVEEERRQRIGSQPTGALDEEFDRRFWGLQHPYSWPATGRSEDLRQLRLEDARRHFETFYRGSRLTVALVGDVEPEQVRRWAELYFGRLPADTPAPAAPPTPTLPPPPRFEGTCACPARVELRFPTVPFGHPDSAPLDVLAGLLNGRSGRLHRSLVLDQGVAFFSSSLHAPLRLGGTFTVVAEGREGSSPKALETALVAEIDRLRAEPPTAIELTRVGNQISTDAWREVRSPLSLALRLLVYDAMGEWSHLDAWPRRLAAVTAEQVRAAALRYLAPERAAVALYHRETAP